MRQYLNIFCVLISAYAFSQEPTQFDKFINQPVIQWAANVTDTIRFSETNLSELLRKRFHAKEIKASLPQQAPLKINYVNEQAIDQLIFRAVADTLLDSNGNVTTRYTIYHYEETDRNSDLIHLNQILFIENGKLRSYVPYAAPVVSIATSMGIYIGYSDYFLSCFNFNYNFQSAKNDKIIFLGTTKRKFNIENFEKKNMLKELYGKNLLETLWNDIANNKFIIINAATGKKVLLKDLENDTQQQVTVPVYDASGNIIEGKTVHEPLAPDLFNQIEITQKWFYNATKNVVINDVVDMTVFFKPETDNSELKPFFKVVFK